MGRTDRAPPNPPKAAGGSCSTGILACVVLILLRPCALVAADRVLFERNARRHSDALQLVAGHLVAFDEIAARDSRPLRAASQVNATPQQIVAGMRQIQIPELVSQNLIGTSDHEDSSVLPAVDGVSGHGNSGRLHVRVAIVHDDAEVPLVRAHVPGDFSVMEAIQVDALPVDLRKPVAGITAVIHIAGGIDSYRDRIHLGLGISDTLSGILFRFYDAGVTGLN